MSLQGDRDAFVRALDELLVEGYAHMSQLPLTFPTPRQTFERRHALAKVATTLRQCADTANRNDQGNTGTTLTIAARLVSDNNVGEAWAMLRMGARVAGIVRKGLRGPKYLVESVAYRQRAYLAAARLIGATLGHGTAVRVAMATYPAWEVYDDGMTYGRSVENSLHPGITEGSSVRVEQWRRGYAVEVYLAFPTWARDDFQWRETCETLEEAKETARRWVAFADVVLGAACAAYGRKPE